MDSLWGKFTPSLPLFVGVDGVGIPREHDSESNEAVDCERVRLRQRESESER